MTKYNVELTRSAGETYQRISESAMKCIEGGDAANSKVALLRTVDDLIGSVIPEGPYEKGRSLAGSLLNIYWVSRGRLRVFYKASPTKPLVIVVLSISESPRKEAHPRHAEALLAEMMLSGQLDHLLSPMGRQAISVATAHRPPN
jgi:hypothetical protein